MEDCIQDGLIITATITEIYFALKNVQPPNTSLYAIND